jgi:transposase
VNLLDWPPQLPDLVPIENLWKIAKDRIANKRHKIQDINQIGNTVVEEIGNFESDLLEKLSKSFTTRVKLYIKAKCGSIKY